MEVAFGAFPKTLRVLKKASGLLGILQGLRLAESLGQVAQLPYILALMAWQ